MSPVIRRGGSSSKGFLPYYFLVGEEPYLRRREIRALAARLSGSPSPPPWEILEGESASAGRILEAVRTPPLDLFAAARETRAGRRLVVVEGAEKVPPREYGFLREYFADPSPLACLVFAVHRPYKEWKPPAGVPPAAVIRCSPFSGERLRSWILEEARRRGLSLPAEAMEELLDSAGGNMLAISGELDKFSVYRGGPGDLTSEEVRELTGRSGNADIFALIRHIVTGDAERARALTRRLLEAGDHPLKVLSSLTGSFRRLWRGREVWEGSRSSADACTAAGIKWYREVFIDQVRRFRLDRIPGVFGRLFAASLAMKGEEKSPALALERLVIDLADLFSPPAQMVKRD